MHTGVLIYEDNDSLRESLCNMITFSKDMVLLANYSNAEQVEHQVKETNPDVILMDIDMPGVNGIDAVKIIRKFNGDVQIIMLTVFDDNKHVYNPICAGASGYLLKKSISDKLLTSIKEVMNGEAPMSPGIARMIIQNIQDLPKKKKTNIILHPVKKKSFLHLQKAIAIK